MNANVQFLTFDVVTPSGKATAVGLEEREDQPRHPKRLGVWSVVEQSSKQIGIEHFGAHDLRRTCAKLCRRNGGDLEQIKFLLGHSSIQTTERYLGSEQDIEIAVNDNLGL
jgi:integrase